MGVYFPLMFDTCIPLRDQTSHGKLSASSLLPEELKSSPHHYINPLYHLYSVYNVYIRIKIMCIYIIILCMKKCIKKGRSRGRGWKMIRYMYGFHTVSLTTVSPVVCLLWRSHIHIWPDLHPVAMPDWDRAVVRLADGAYLMTQGPATPEHNRDGDLYGRHARQLVPVALWEQRRRIGDSCSIVFSLLLQQRARLNARKIYGSILKYTDITACQ